MRIYIFKGFEYPEKKCYFAQDCDTREKSRLMENEVTSPVDDINESST